MGKYKPGDKVQIRPDLHFSWDGYGGVVCSKGMVKHAGEVVTILAIPILHFQRDVYLIEERLTECKPHWLWHEDMFSGIVIDSEPQLEQEDDHSWEELF